MPKWLIRIIETPDEMVTIEELQRQVWTGSETDVIPAHMLLAAVHNGGLILGAYPATVEDYQGNHETDLADPGGAFPGEEADSGLNGEADSIEPAQDVPFSPPPPPGAPLVGFVFGFPGLYSTPDGPRPKHASHLLAVHPNYRNQGIGFLLKRAQWQMVRHQGLDRITWTYDPLLSRNAYLNITRLGAVCSTYRRDEYGSMRDGMNAGLPSDRFQVDWWVNSQRVLRRLSRRARLKLDLAHFLAAGSQIINPSQPGPDGLPHPVEPHPLPPEGEIEPLLLLEIPADFLALKTADSGLAAAWRLHTRALFEELFARGYLITDFVHLPGNPARSFYVLSHGESTLS